MYVIFPLAGIVGPNACGLNVGSDSSDVRGSKKKLQYHKENA